MYNAIEGVAGGLYGVAGALWWGLPREEFDETLLWCWSVEEGREFIWNAECPS